MQRPRNASGMDGTDGSMPAAGLADAPQAALAELRDNSGSMGGMKRNEVLGLAKTENLDTTLNPNSFGSAVPALGNFDAKSSTSPTAGIGAPNDSPTPYNLNDDMEYALESEAKKLSEESRFRYKGKRYPSEPAVTAMHRSMKTHSSSSKAIR